MKKLAIIFIALLAASASYAQSAVSGGASQTTNLDLTDVIDISFMNNNTINMQFTTVNDYANGVESSEQAILVRSNKLFNVRVRSRSSRFSYSGPTSPAPRMNVNPVLKLKVTSNNTGGSVMSGFNNYKSPPTSNGTRIIGNATPGGDNTFTVKYFANPGYNFPAGNYTVDIIYTATQV